MDLCAIFVCTRDGDLYFGGVMKKQPAKTKTKVKSARMSPKREQALREILVSRHAELSSEVKEKLTSSRSSDHVNPKDSQDTADLDATHEVELSIIQLKTEEIKKIDLALKRLEEGTYGFCFSCGEPIPEARLKAMPHAGFCRDCQEKR
jgi:DnaK suppressor protein